MTSVTRKNVLRMRNRKWPCSERSSAHAQPFPAFFSSYCSTNTMDVSRVFSYSSSSTMDTEGHPKGVRNRRLCTLHRKLATGSEDFPRSRGCSLRRPRLALVTQVIYPFPAIFISCSTPSITLL